MTTDPKYVVVSFSTDVPWATLVYEDWPDGLARQDDRFERGAHIPEMMRAFAARGIPVYDIDECGVCHTDVGEDYYMVTHEVWREAGVPRCTQVHIACLEQKLGRTLNDQDFPWIVPLNRAFLEAYAVGKLGLNEKWLDHAREQVVVPRTGDHMIRLGYEMGRRDAGRNG